MYESSYLRLTPEEAQLVPLSLLIQQEEEAAVAVAPPDALPDAAPDFPLAVSLLAPLHVGPQEGEEGERKMLVKTD